jgi:hypothetical protein
MSPDQVEVVVASDSQRWAQEFAALTELLTLAQWSDGDLDKRLLALPDPLFARAALDLYALGWVDAA